MHSPTMTEWDKIRHMMTDAEYKAWVERGVWPKRLNQAKAEYVKRLNARRKADANRQN